MKIIIYLKITIYDLFNMINTSQNLDMTKMPYMQKILNLLLVAGKDDQLAYSILFTP